jgi:hypothetical protein
MNIPVRCYRARYLSLLLLLVGLLGGSPALAALPSASDGVLDLRTYDFDKEGPVKLQGEWLFWWGRLGRHYETLGEPTHEIEVPGVWTALIDDGASP